MTANRDAMLSDSDYILQTIERAKAGDAACGEEALDLFVGAVYSSQIGGATEAHQRLAEFIAACFNRFAQGESLDVALNVAGQRRKGQPRGTTKDDKTAYAAMLILLARQLGSAERAKDRILQFDAECGYKKRALDSIYKTHAPMRALDHDDLIACLNPRLRRVLTDSLR